jgi:hypothetical protein
MESVGKKIKKLYLEVIRKDVREEKRMKKLNE